MTKKEYCQKYPAVAYYSGFDGFEIHGIECGIDNYIIGVSGACGNPKNRTFHRLKVKLTTIRRFRPLFLSFARKKAVSLMHCSSRKSDQLSAWMILSDSRAPKIRNILTIKGKNCGRN